MDQLNDYAAINISNSPLEFVLTGPVGKHSAVLVKSNDAGLDLIGAAEISKEAFKLFEKKRPRRSNIVYSIMNSRDDFKSILQRVDTDGLSNLPDNNDQRISNYVMVWKGYADDEELSTIEKELNLRSSELHDAIKRKSESEIEWLVSPVILICNKANEAIISRKNASKRAFYFMMIVYVALAISAVVLQVMRSSGLFG